MSLLVAIVVGCLFAGGVYLCLQRHALEILLGLMLLSQGTNLVIIAAAGWTPRALPPILVEAPDVVDDPDSGAPAKVARIDPARYVDPMPQALILTAIVIGFGLLSFLMVLLSRAHELDGRLDFTELADDPRADEEPRLSRVDAHADDHDDAPHVAAGARRPPPAEVAAPRADDDEDDEEEAPRR